MPYAQGKPPRKGERLEPAAGCGYLPEGWHDVECLLAEDEIGLCLQVVGRPGSFTIIQSPSPHSSVRIGEKYRAYVEYGKGVYIWKDNDYFCVRDAEGTMLILWTKHDKFAETFQRAGFKIARPEVKEIWSEDGKHKLHPIEETEQATTQTTKPTLDGHS